MVRIPARRRTVGDTNAGPADEQTQYGGTDVRFGGGFILQPGNDGGPARWAHHGGRVRTDIGARNDYGGWLHFSLFVLQKLFGEARGSTVIKRLTRTYYRFPC